MILSIILKSLRESVKPRRFLPFFLLYSIFSLSALIFAMPILSIIPSLISLQFTNAQIAVVMVNMVGLLIVFLLIVLLNIWFTGALVHGLFKNKGFAAGLNYSQKLYWQMLMLSFIIFVFSGVASLLRGFGIVITALIDLVFMFSLPAVIVKKYNFKLALTRSYNLVKNKIIETFLFWLTMHIVNFLIIFIGLFFAALIAMPLFLNIMSLLPLLTQFTTITNQQVVQVIDLILSSYPTFIVASIIGSFFMSISHVFRYASRTFYLLKFRGKR